MKVFGEAEDLAERTGIRQAFRNVATAQPGFFRGICITVQ